MTSVVSQVTQSGPKTGAIRIFFSRPDKQSIFESISIFILSHIDLKISHEFISYKRIKLSLKKTTHPNKGKLTSSFKTKDKNSLLFSWRILGATDQFCPSLSPNPEKKTLIINCLISFMNVIKLCSKLLLKIKLRGPPAKQLL